MGMPLELAQARPIFLSLEMLTSTETPLDDEDEAEELDCELDLASDLD